MLTCSPLPFGRFGRRSRAKRGKTSGARAMQSEKSVDSSPNGTLGKDKEEGGATYDSWRTADDSGTRLLRPLGLHEKFNVARHNTGEAPVIVLAAVLDVIVAPDAYAQALNSLKAETLARVQQLLNHRDNGLLRCSVQGSTKTKPRYQMEESIGAAQVFHEKVLDLVDAQPYAPRSLLETIIRREVEETAVQFRLEDALPLWSVSIYELPASDVQSAHRRTAVLALSIHHAICDGKGAQSLLHALLKGLPAGEAEKVALDGEGPQSVPPSSNETLPMDPPLFKLVLPLALVKFVMPKLAPVIPPRVRHTYTRPPAWPALRAKPDGQPSRNEPTHRWLSREAPASTKPALRMVTYDTLELVDGMKRVSKSNGVATIHSTIHACMVVALSAALEACAPGSGCDQYVYASETPVNHRTASLGHGEFTGNYIGVCWWRSDVARKTSFWDAARDYAALISDEGKRREALISIGLLKFVKASPENRKVVPGSTAEMVGAEPATGWEQWWYEKSRGRRPHRVSAGLSNLGISQLDGEVVPGVHASQVAMMQVPSSIGPAIDVDVMGYRRRRLPGDLDGLVAGKGEFEGGLNLSVSWRAGVVDGTIPEDFADALAVLGAMVADGRMHDSITVGEAVALVLPQLPRYAALRNGSPELF